MRENKAYLRKTEEQTVTRSNQVLTYQCVFRRDKRGRKKEAESVREADQAKY